MGSWHSSPIDKLIHSIIEFQKNGGKTPVFSDEELEHLMSIDHISVEMSLKFPLDYCFITSDDIVLNYKDADIFKNAVWSMLVKSAGGYIVSHLGDRIIIDALVRK